MGKEGFVVEFSGGIDLCPTRFTMVLVDRLGLGTGREGERLAATFASFCDGPGAGKGLREVLHGGSLGLGFDGYGEIGFLGWGECRGWGLIIAFIVPSFAAKIGCWQGYKLLFAGKDAAGQLLLFNG